MAWFKCGGGGIPAAIKSLMNAVLNKKWGTSGTYPPETWPETVNLMGPLEEKTVSGSIVVFSDGADEVPLKSCAVTIAPNLDGVSSVDVVHGGYNFIDASTAEYGNLDINTGNVDTTSTSWKTTDFMPLFAGDFFFTWVSSSTYFQVKWVAYDSNKIRIDGESTATWTSVYSKQFTFPTGTAFVRFCWSVVVSGSPVTREDIRLNRGTVDLGYTEYVQPTIHTASLGRVIYGGTPDVVNGTGTETAGKSVLDPTETWLFSSAWSKTNTNVFYTQATHDEISFSTWNDNSILLCDGTLPVGTRNEINNADANMIGVSGNVGHPCITVRIDKTTCPDLASFIQYITNNQISFVYKKATPEDFTFTPVPIISRLGDNTMWSDGDLSVVYRSSGTQTIITPTLISKTVTENGTYSAEDDGADGYDAVVVNVQGGAQNIETVLGDDPLIEITGVSGTDVSRVMWTRTAAAAEKIVFHPNTKVKTNTGANDGYFKVLKNDVVVASTYANTSTTTSLSIPDIDLEAGDVLTISAGFDNNHSSCWFDLYSTITILSSGSAPVLGLGLGNPGPVSEPEQEEEPEEIQEETPEEVDQNESDE